MINRCPFMLARYYLPMRHDMITKKLFKEVIRKNHQKTKPTKEINEPEYIQKFVDCEYL